MPAELSPAPAAQEFFWDDLLEYIGERRVIPIVGAELLTVPDGAGGELPLMRVLAQKLAERLRVSAEDCSGDDALHHVVCRYLQRGGRREDVYPRIRMLLKELAPAVPPTTNLGKSGKLRRLNEARRDLVFAALKTGRFEEAEQVLRRIAEDRDEAGASERVMDQVWLAHALLRQNRIEAARSELSRVADRLLTRPREIDSNLMVRFDYLYALYTQAALQPADVGGAVRRGELLAQAVALCNEQSDEVKGTNVYKDVRALIDEAVKQTVP